MNGYSGIYLVGDLFIDALGRQWFTEFSLRALLSATLGLLAPIGQSIELRSYVRGTIDGDKPENWHKIMAGSES